jgi:hypothetical protein
VRYACLLGMHLLYSNRGLSVGPLPDAWLLNNIYS